MRHASELRHRHQLRRLGIEDTGNFIFSTVVLVPKPRSKDAFERVRAEVEDKQDAFEQVRAEVEARQDQGVRELDDCIAKMEQQGQLAPLPEAQLLGQGRSPTRR